MLQGGLVVQQVEVDMQFLVWCVDKPDMYDKRMAVIEDHWAFYEPYAENLIARGPTLNPNDFNELTGSVHIYDVDGLDVLQHCVYEDPFAKAGVFDTILIKRFTLGLNGTQFEFEREPGRPQYFLYCPAKVGSDGEREEIRESHEAYCRAQDSRIISQGDIWTDDDVWEGNVYFVEAASNTDAETFLRDEPYNAAGLLDSAQVLRWKMGGRWPLISSS
jgi:uncharacterized protein